MTEKKGIRSKFGGNFIQVNDSPHGIGPSHSMFINCDNLVDTSKFDELHEEVMIGLSTMPQEDMLWSRFGGTMPPGKYEDLVLEAEILSEELLSEREKEIISTMDIQQVRKFLYFSRGALKPWAFNVYLRWGQFEKKTSQHALDWNPVADYFPKVQEFLKSLPFESMGRILFFCTDGFREVPVHRDQRPETHYDHGMNFFFDGNRGSYIYDPNTEEKKYLDKSARSYFFNNRDYHGVDSEDRFRYTLRIDGTFNDEAKEYMGLYEDGAVMRSEE